MKWLLVAVALACAWTAEPAWAHGGGFRDGPPGAIPPGMREPTDPLPPPPPPPPCKWCASPTCPHCSDAELVSGIGLQRREDRKVLTQWIDLVHVRHTIRMRAEGPTWREGYAHLVAGPVLAVTNAEIRLGSSVLRATEDDPKRANPTYLLTRNRSRDPLLVTRASLGAFHVRAFPVPVDGETTVVVEGYELSRSAARCTTLYRTGERFLAIVPITSRTSKEDLEAADLVDERGRRFLRFLDRAEATKRFPSLVGLEREVPCVDALERTVRGTETGTWIAVPEDAVRPPEPAGAPPATAAPAEPAPVTPADVDATVRAGP